MKNYKSYHLPLAALLVFSSFAFNPGDLKAANIPDENEVVVSINGPSKQYLPSKKIKILVWNLFKGSKETFAAEYLALAAENDIILGQEFLLNKKMDAIFKQSPDISYTIATSFYVGKDKTRTGVTNASSVGPVFTKFIKTKKGEPGLGSPKMSLVTTYPIENSDKQLTVVNIHAINFVSNKTFRAEIKQIYEEIKDIPAPLIFAGDFNTWNAERLSILDQYRKKLNLTEAVFSPDNRMKFVGKPLDHFLHSQDIKITSAKVEKSFTGSDHQPLQVELDIIPE